MVKYLIIRFSSIGDIVLTTPVIRCIKEQVEGAKIYYLTKKQFTGILSHNPYIDKLYELDNNLPELLKEIKKERIHYIIDLHKNLRTYRVKQMLGSTPFSFDKINLQKWLIVNLKINKLPSEHIVDRYLKTTYLFDVKNDNKGLDYFIPEEEEVNIKSEFNYTPLEYIGIVIGGTYYTKKLPIEKMISLCEKIKSPILLLGGKEDFENGEVIKNAVSGKIINTCGKYNLNQSASLVKQCKALITHDTGLMHIGAAFKKKIISLWGNTIPEFGMSAYQADPASRIFETKNLSCRPCSKLGYDKCPKEHFRCMNDIDLDEVAGAVE